MALDCISIVAVLQTKKDFDGRRTTHFVWHIIRYVFTWTHGDIIYVHHSNTSGMDHSTYIIVICIDNVCFIARRWLTPETHITMQIVSSTDQYIGFPTWINNFIHL